MESLAVRTPEPTASVAAVAPAVSLAPLVAKLKPLFADGVQASDFPRAAVICAGEAEVLGRALHLTGEQKLKLVGEALVEASGGNAEVQTFVQVGLPLVMQGAVLANKLGLGSRFRLSCCA